MTHDSTNALGLSSKRRTSGFLAKEIELALDQKCDELPFSYTVPVTTVDHCPWCNRRVAICYLENQEYFADLESDDDGTIRAVLTSPHLCAESQRHEDFLRLDEEPCL
jgi:hypothetical protein